MNFFSRLFRGKYDDIEFLFTAKVDFISGSARNPKGQKLYPENTYYIEDKEINGSEVEKIIKNSLREQLPNDLYDILHVKSEVDIRKVNYGSIEVIYTVLLSLGSVYYGISKYKNFIDSCELIKKQAGKIINSALKNRYGDGIFEVNVQSEMPNRQVNTSSSSSSNRSRRDAFFYYLLMMNIILFCIIGLLVSKAVISFYHW